MNKKLLAVLCTSIALVSIGGIIYVAKSPPSFSRTLKFFEEPDILKCLKEKDNKTLKENPSLCAKMSGYLIQVCTYLNTTGAKLTNEQMDSLKIVYEKLSDSEFLKFLKIEPKILIDMKETFKLVFLLREIQETGKLGDVCSSSVSHKTALLRKLIEKVNSEKEVKKVKKILEAEFICKLLDAASKITATEPPFLSLRIPIGKTVSVFGDFHGSFDKNTLEAILEKLNKGHMVVITGDYVDRGRYSLELLAWLSFAKICYPDQLFFLIGNHDRFTGQIKTHEYSCEREVLHKKYDTPQASNLKTSIDTFFKNISAIAHCIFPNGSSFLASHSSPSELMIKNRSVQLLRNRVNSYYRKGHDLLGGDNNDHLFWTDIFYGSKLKIFELNKNSVTGRHEEDESSLRSLLKEFGINTLIHGHSHMDEFMCPTGSHYTVMSFKSGKSILARYATVFITENGEFKVEENKLDIEDIEILTFK